MNTANRQCAIRAILVQEYDIKRMIMEKCKLPTLRRGIASKRSDLPRVCLVHFPFGNHAGPWVAQFLMAAASGSGLAVVSRAYLMQ